MELPKRYICDCCGEEFPEEAINFTTLDEMLCNNCFIGHPESPDSERIDGKEKE